jgi:hypothetical protein
MQSSNITDCAPLSTRQNLPQRIRFDRYTRHGIRLIQGGKSLTDVAMEHSVQIAQAAPDAAVADVIEGAMMILIIAAGMELSRPFGSSSVARME